MSVFRLPYYPHRFFLIKNRIMNLFRFTISVIAIAAFSGCSVYKIDVQQGNVITQEMVSQLRPQMTKDQVHFILGTPVLTDVFHANRWDYVYRMQRGGGAVEARKFATIFDEEGRLTQIIGDIAALPTSGAFADSRRQMQEMDLGSIGDDARASPVRERGIFGRMRRR